MRKIALFYMIVGSFCAPYVVAPPNIQQLPNTISTQELHTPDICTLFPFLCR